MKCKTFIEVTAEIGDKRISYQEKNGVGFFNISDFGEASPFELTEICKFFKVVSEDKARRDGAI